MGGVDAVGEFGRLDAVASDGVADALPSFVPAEHLHWDGVEVEDVRDGEAMVPLGPDDLAVACDDDERFQFARVRRLESIVGVGGLVAVF